MAKFYDFKKSIFNVLKSSIFAIQFVFPLNKDENNVELTLNI